MDESIPEKNFTPAIVVGYLNNEFGKVAATTLPSDLEINSVNVAAMLLCLYQVCENNIPESEQLEFEAETLEFLTEMLASRHEYTSTYNFIKEKDEEE